MGGTSGSYVLYVPLRVQGIDMFARLLAKSGCPW